MGTRRNKGLRTTERLGQLEALSLVNVLAKKWQVMLFLLLDVLREVGPEVFERGDEVWCAGGEVLEGFEIFLDLFRLSIFCFHQSSWR